MTKIEWARNEDGSQGQTWNPITGCTKVSPGCKNCYALTMAKRIKGMGLPQYQNVVNGRNWTGVIEFVPDALDKPRKRKKPTTWFVNSMSDLFHEEVEEDWLSAIWQVMAETPQHTYQILTKRAKLLPGRVQVMVDRYGILDNIWLGVSVESGQYTSRIDYLRRTPAAVRFLSLEPLLGPLPGLNLDGIHWVIVGGESGPGARPMNPNWVRQIRDQCFVSPVSFFFKQWGAFDPWGNRVGKARAGRLLDGQLWDEMPELRLPEVMI